MGLKVWSVFFIFLLASCSWTLDGIPKWKQDLWNCKSIDRHLGDLFNNFFQMQRDKIHTKERRRRVERREKVGRRVVLEGRWDRWLYEYIMVHGLLLLCGLFFFLKV